jgi:alpha-D-ribose 1-methylphosphonate 5-triphosphate synthase subunit PhnH
MRRSISKAVSPIRRATAAHAFRARFRRSAGRAGSRRSGRRHAARALFARGGALLLTLCDGTTPLHLAPSHDSEALRGWITFHTGAPLVPRRAAAFALGTWEALQPIARFAIGTAEYPDRAATLIVEMPALTASGARADRAGHRDRGALSLPETAAFQANRARFPLGFDCFSPAATASPACRAAPGIEEG